VPAASAAAAPAPAVIKQAAVIAPPPPEPGLMDQVLDNSLPLGVGALLALLAGLGFARYRKNKKTGHVDSSFLDSRLQPDSFFGASGGRRVDTSENLAEGSSMAYSPSQLDAAGDVDPVAEADVYLAYGRDQQAEEILREALRTYPARLAIHAKLLEIFAKRRDNKAFESVALTAFKLSKGRGPEWSYITELGRDLDPANSMYQPGASPSTNGTETRASAFTPASAVAPLDLSVMPAPSTKAIDLDLDLDFSLDEAPEASMIPAAIAAPAPYIAPQVAGVGAGMAMPPSAILNLDDLDLDLDLNLDNSPAAVLPVTPPPQAPASATEFSPEIDFLSEGLDFTPEPYAAPKAPVAPAAPVTHSGMLEFDLDSLSLDLGPATKAPPPAMTEPEEDPLEIKFLLAEEFRILGDSDGARSLADEVLAKARGPLKVKAQAFLNALS
jgi:pilus assembly protein FimV